MGKGKEEGRDLELPSPCTRVGGVSPSPHPAPGRYPRIILVFPKIILTFSRNILNSPLSHEGLSDLKKGGSSCPSTLRVLPSLPRIIPKLQQCYPKFFPGLSHLFPGIPKFPPINKFRAPIKTDQWFSRQFGGVFVFPHLPLPIFGVFPELFLK